MKRKLRKKSKEKRYTALILLSVLHQVESGPAKLIKKRLSYARVRWVLVSVIIVRHSELGLGFSNYRTPE